MNRKLIKFVLILVISLSLMGCSERNEVENAYSIMVNAKNEDRELTEKEITEVENVAYSLISFNEDMTENEKNLHRAISAMYLNYKIDPAFEEAKESYEKYR